MREEIRVLRRKISRGELIHSWSKMKQHLLFCSLLVCLPAFTAHLYSSEIGIQANSKTDTHSPLFTKITSGSYVLQLRGGGDHFSKDIQAGATTVARHARLVWSPKKFPCICRNSPPLLVCSFVLFVRPAVLDIDHLHVRFLHLGMCRNTRR